MRRSPRRPLILRRRKLPFQQNDPPAAEPGNRPASGPEQASGPSPGWCFPDGVRVLDHPCVSDTKVVVIPKTADVQNVIQALSANGKDSGPSKFILLGGNAAPDPGPAAGQKEEEGSARNPACRSEEMTQRPPNKPAAALRTRSEQGPGAPPVRRQPRQHPEPQRNQRLGRASTTRQGEGEFASAGWPRLPAASACCGRGRAAGGAAAVLLHGTDPVCHQQPPEQEDDAEGDLHLDRGALPLLPTGGQAGMEGSPDDSVGMATEQTLKPTRLIPAEFHPPQPLASRHVHPGDVSGRQNFLLDHPARGQPLHHAGSGLQDGNRPSRRPRPGADAVTVPAEKRMKPLLPRADCYLVPVQLPVGSPVFLPACGAPFTLSSSRQRTSRGGKRVRIVPKVAQGDAPSAEPVKCEAPERPPQRAARSSRRKQRLVHSRQEEPVLLCPESTLFDSGVASDSGEAEPLQNRSPDQAFSFKTPVKASGRRLTSSTPSRPPAEDAALPWKVTPVGKGTVLDFSPIRTPGGPAVTPQRDYTTFSLDSTPFKELPLLGSPREPQGGNQSLTEGLMLDLMNDSLSKILVDISFPGLEDEDMAMANISWSELLPQLK
ncbi:unnamed protein product [Tetraodon nigroviridis]|uniref:(spotted green pufferfish) hypothetical protein n=1 Tax=Tetraodon nigroviridis TaxID=99883 RepID=Q4SAC8_TETNG|nr:unnamed protein product [Tetraodon nigroviridis]